MTEIERIRAIVDNAKANNVPVYTLNTEDLDDLLAALDILEAGSRPYKVYSAIINQAGSLAAPVMTVLENTLGAVPLPGVADDGQFDLTSVGLFPAGKTFIQSIPGSFPGSGMFLNVFRGSDDTIILYNLDLSGTYDNGIVNGMIEIRVYP